MVRQMMLLAALLCVGCGGAENIRTTADGAQTQPPSQLNTDSDHASQSTHNRKVIYEADVDVTVEDLSLAETKLNELIASAGGYTANASLSGSSGKFPFGRWEVRIPSNKFKTFINDVKALGITNSFQQSAQDVTLEYIDLESRVTNMKHLEQRVLDLLDKSKSHIDEILKLEHELSRIRGDVEQIEGRLKYLTNQIEMSKIQIQLHQKQIYAPQEDPNFQIRIATAWNHSMEAFQEFLEGGFIALIFLAPWLVSIIIIAIPAWLLTRKTKKHRPATPT